MADEPLEVLEHSPDRLLTGFSKTKLARYLVIAVVIHIVATAATSVGYIRDRWIDPEGAARRKAEQLEARKADAQGAKSKVESRRPDARRPQPKEAKALTPEEARKNTPVMKEITDLPKKGEIPAQPDDLGISIDETNR